MKRTTLPSSNGNGQAVNYDTRPSILDGHSLIGRAMLASVLGYSHDGNRNVYTALGYDTSITFNQYAGQYARHALAKALINRPINVTWNGPLEISEGSDEDETPLEKEYKKLAKKLRLKSAFKRVDKLSQLGEYGVLFLGLNDTAGVDGLQNPVTGGNKRLLYVKPFSQEHAEIKEYVERSNDPRYGLPLYYELDMSRLDNSNRTNLPIKVHHSRIIHVPGELLESEIHGIPYLKAGWNNLKDVEKILGGSAEMFWLGARPGYQFELKDGKRIAQGELDSIKEQINEWEHGLRRVLETQGIDINALAAQISDPSAHLDSQIKALAAAYEIPKRILEGSERGELSSGQDRTEWLERIQSRREEMVEPQIVREFVDRCIGYGILPPAQEDDYEVNWSDLFAPSEKDKAEVGRTRAEALKLYTANPRLEEIFPFEQFVTHLLGLSDQDRDKVLESVEQMQREEELNRPTPEEQAMEQQQPPIQEEEE